MPSFAAALRAMSDCVQNQTTSAPAIAPARRPTPDQDRPARMVIMGSEVWGLGSGGLGAPAGFAFLQHHFQLPSEFIRNGIAVGTAIARRVCFDRFADRDDRVQRRMRAGGVGQIFLVMLDGLQQTLGGRRIGEVVARVTMQLIGQILVGRGRTSGAAVGSTIDIRNPTKMVRRMNGSSIKSSRGHDTDRESRKHVKPTLSVILPQYVRETRNNKACSKLHS